MKPMRTAAFMAGLTLTTGCFATSSVSSIPAPSLSPELRLGSMADATAFERRVAVEQPKAVGDDAPPPEPEAQRARKIAFWTGIGLASLGTVSTIAFGVTGRVAQFKLDQGYEDSNLSRADEDRLVGLGETSNILAATSAAVGIVGLITASVAYGLDYGRCGTLARRRRKDCEPRD